MFLFRFQVPNSTTVHKASLWRVAVENGDTSKIFDHRLFDEPINYFKR